MTLTFNKTGRYFFNCKTDKTNDFLEIHVYYNAIMDVKLEDGTNVGGRRDGDDIFILGFERYISAFLPEKTKNKPCLPYSGARIQGRPDSFLWHEYRDNNEVVESSSTQDILDFGIVEESKNENRQMTWDTTRSYDVDAGGGTFCFDMYDELSNEKLAGKDKSLLPYTDTCSQAHPLHNLSFSITGVQRVDDKFPTGIFAIHTHIKNDEKSTSQLKDVYDYVTTHIGLNLGNKMVSPSFDKDGFFNKKTSRMVMRVGVLLEERLEIYPCNTEMWYDIRNNGYQLFMKLSAVIGDHRTSTNRFSILQQDIKNVNI